MQGTVIDVNPQSGMAVAAAKDGRYSVIAAEPGAVVPGDVLLGTLAPSGRAILRNATRAADIEVFIRSVFKSRPAALTAARIAARMLWYH